MFVLEFQQMAEFMNQMIFVRIQHPVRIYNIPQRFNKVDLIFQRIILIDKAGKMLQIDAFTALPFRGRNQLRAFCLAQVKSVFYDFSDQFFFIVSEFIITVCDFKK